jgi:hypothetical protein
LDEDISGGRLYACDVSCGPDEGGEIKCDGAWPAAYISEPMNILKYHTRLYIDNKHNNLRQCGRGAYVTLHRNNEFLK